MLTLIIYFLCVYIVLKGVQIFQIALMSNRENRRAGLIIGVLAIIASLGAAAFFGYIATEQAIESQRQLQQLQNLHF